MTGSGKELVPVAKRPVGAPKGSGSLYTDEIADEIVDRLIDGETLVSICKFDVWGNPRIRGEFPNHATVYDWGDPAAPHHIPSFVTRFARAKQAQHRNWIESTVDIARNPEPSIEEVVEHSTKHGVTIRRSRKDALGHRALKIETLLRAAAKMDPQHWADRLQQVPQDAGLVDGTPPRLIIEGGLPDEEAPVEE